MVECRGCGEEISNQASFCSKCGLRTEHGEKQGVKTPVDNRAYWEREMELAIENATQILDEAFTKAKEGLKALADEIESELDKVKVRRSQVSNPIYCPRCGKINPSDSDYCTVCGAKI
jgi:uncharacterized membrane protein YvbJ